MKHLLSSTAGFVLVALAVPASAESFTHEGLTVDLPEGYTAEVLPSDSPPLFKIAIRPPAGGPRPMASYGGNLCKLTYAPREGDRLTQAGLETKVQAETYPFGEYMIATDVFAEPARETFTLANDAALGVEHYGVPVIGEDRQGIWYLAYSETPVATMLLDCSALEPDFEAALPVIRAIRDSIVPPA